MKNKNSYDDYCKRVRAKIKENREKFRAQEHEFSFIFNNPNAEMSVAVYD